MSGNCYYRTLDDYGFIEEKSNGKPGGEVDFAQIGPSPPSPPVPEQ
tara:strand:- start:216 stop:353 length:138 start_codon:yes stop_codon:yes gene_type:complete